MVGSVHVTHVYMRINFQTLNGGRNVSNWTQSIQSVTCVLPFTLTPKRGKRWLQVQTTTNLSKDRPPTSTKPAMDVLSAVSYDAQVLVLQ